MAIQRWSLKSKLLGSFGAITVIVFLIGAVDFFMIHRISNTYTDIVEKNTSKQVAILELNITLLNLNTLLREAYMEKDKDLRKSLISKMHHLHDEYRKTAEVIKKISLTSDNQAESQIEETYGQLKKTWVSIETDTDKLVTFLKAGTEGDIEYIQTMDTYKISLEEYKTQSLKLNSMQEKLIETQIARVNTIKIWSEGISLSLVLLGIMLPLILGSISSKNISLALRQISDELAHGASLLKGISGEMATSSNSLSVSTTAQGSALQETMAAISQMAAMIGKNSANTNKSQKDSESSATAAGKGQEAVEFMVGSIEEIETSNKEIMGRIEMSHKEMSEIVQVINEIAQKTKVINEIVFQTKLLSFNASVEAARAGEHGKGFAVVAEEVGNLAQMSGTAAKDITQLLDQSVQKVENTVKRTRTEVEHMMSLGSDKVRKGIEGGRRCGEVLSEIVVSVNGVHATLVEIAKASAEQASGVSEVEKAMIQLNEITQSNSASAQMSLFNSDNLKSQANQIVTIVEELDGLLNGVGQGVKAVHPVSSSTNVLAFRPKDDINLHQRVKSKNAIVPTHAKNHHSSEKVAVAASHLDSNVPDQDDKRFEDV